MSFIIKLSMFVLGIAMIPTQGYAQSLDDAVGEMTRQVSSFLKQESRDKVSIGRFDRQFETAMGRDIQEKCRRELVANDIHVVETACDTQLRGTFSSRVVSTHSILTLKLTLVNAQGRVLIQFRKRIKLLQ